MKTVDPAIVAAYALGADTRYTAFQIVELIGGAATYRFTDAPIPIIWGGHTWLNVYFESSDIVVDSEGEVMGTYTFEDASKTLRALALANDLNDFELKHSEIWADATNTIFGQDIKMHGTIDGFKSTGEDTQNPIATVAVRGLFGASAVVIGPTQEYSRNCRYHHFKGEECKYVGAATFCDRLYGTCTTLGNTINFGGFRFALQAGETMLWGTIGGKLEARPIPAYEPPPTNTGGGVTPVIPPPPPSKRRAAGR